MERRTADMNSVSHCVLSAAGVVVLGLASCRQPARSNPDGASSAIASTDLTRTERLTDAEEVWIRLRRALLLRTDPDGKELGLVELDPLLWPESSYPLRSPRYEEVGALLTQVPRTDSSTSPRDPLRRALLQP